MYFAHAHYNSTRQKLKMAATEVEKINDSVNSLNITDSHQNGVNESNDDFSEKWGFPMDELYKLALRFYKGMQCVYVMFSINRFWCQHDIDTCFLLVLPVI